MNTLMATLGRTHIRPKTNLETPYGQNRDSGKGVTSRTFFITEICIFNMLGVLGERNCPASPTVMELAVHSGVF